MPLKCTVLRQSQAAGAAAYFGQRAHVYVRRVPCESHLTANDMTYNTPSADHHHVRAHKHARVPDHRASCGVLGRTLGDHRVSGARARVVMLLLVIGARFECSD